MVKRAADRLEKIADELDEIRELVHTTDAKLDITIENLRNLQTLAHPDNLLLRVGHDPTLIREFLEAMDVYHLRVAWLGLPEEKRKEIMQAATEAEVEIEADDATA